MGTTEVIILTSIVNIILTGLVGGIIIYVIQKKIDTTIQKSVFEYQTKFSLNHTKAVETLETLYHKFSAFSEGFLDILRDMMNPDNEYKMNLDKYEPNRQCLEDFRIYFLNNRLFVSSDTRDKIYNIHWKAEFLSIVMQLVFKGDLTDEFVRIANVYLHNVAEIDTLNTRKPNLAKLIPQMARAMESQMDILDKLYQSVANIQ